MNHHASATSTLQHDVSLKDALKVQVALTNIYAGTEPAVQEGFSKKPNILDNSDVIKCVEEMRNSRDLDSALGYLSSQDNSQMTGPSGLGAAVKAAQLLAIMSESVYMRDCKSEEKTYQELSYYAPALKSASSDGKPLSETVIEAIGKANTGLEEATSKIKEVAQKMDLEYEPLCNFSVAGWTRGGPYCGAFYSAKAKPFIVITFKGTGQINEWLTDLDIKKVKVKPDTSLKGRCHQGFYNGMFGQLPVAMGQDKTPLKTSPFAVLKEQLKRLVSNIRARLEPNFHKVQLWITGHSLGGAYATICWKSLLAQEDVIVDAVCRNLVTFGSPRVGDRDFARHPRESPNSARSWRFVNGKDMVSALPYLQYFHVNSLVRVSTTRIKMGASEIGRQETLPIQPDPSLPLPESTPEGSISLLGDHHMSSYWKSLRTGKIMTTRRGRENLDDKVDRKGDSVCWSLEPGHPKERVTESLHEDSASGESKQEGFAERQKVPGLEYRPNGRYRSVVKIQSQFGTPQNPVWTMGSGWLIRKDLVVTAGHNVFSKSYRGPATQIKCWIGYHGRDNINDDDVQYRTALNIVTTKEWHKQAGRRQLHDVALIQVSEPFSGTPEELRLFDFEETPKSSNAAYLVVVGYPGDKHTDEDKGDMGGQMYMAEKSVEYDLNQSKSGMVEYPINTYGGQSGAPVLMSFKGKLKGIATHVYGGAGKRGMNCGNPIGQYGNDLEGMKATLRGSKEEKPEALFKQLRPGTGEDDNSDSDGGENLEPVQESFWDIFKKIAKVGSVALPMAGPFLGPLGGLLGTVTGGVLGSLSESVEDNSESAGLNTADIQAERAQLAEAVLQSVMRLERSTVSNKVFEEMQKIWDRDHLPKIGHLVQLIGPLLSSFGLRIAEHHWSSGIRPNRGAKKLGDPVTLVEPSAESYSSALIEALFRNDTRRLEGIPPEGTDRDSLQRWLGPLMEHAVLAPPLVRESTKKSLGSPPRNGDSHPESAVYSDEDTSSGERIIQRAIMADCALQAVKTLSEGSLLRLQLAPDSQGQQEGFIDAIKTATQRIGPVCLRFAKDAIKQAIPILAKKMTDGLTAKESVMLSLDHRAAALSSTMYALKTAESDGFPPGYKNPDSPPLEPFPPPSPVD